MEKKKKKRLIIIGCTLVVVILIVIIAASSNKKESGAIKTVKVERKTIVDKALAVGSIEPLNEIAVKSKNSGVVGKLFVDVGDFVEKGQPLLEVRPDPTPLELVDAKRNVEMQRISAETLKRELERNKELKAKGLISEYDFEQLQRDYDQAALSLVIAQEQLDLLEKGRVQIADKNIETVVNAPITGYILEKTINVGDPVVPLTSYQAGTELLKMANMENLIFRGTVDEIDVGKIKEQMKAELQIGALPRKNVIGHVTLISLKARKEDNTTVFPVEVVIDDIDDAVLRAGFSANANVIISRKDSVLTIPERVVTFRNDSSFVNIPEGVEGSKEIPIKTGLSNAIIIEVISGLEEGDKVLEKKIPEIT